ncbi:hypothetical protein QL285_009295 [Trifolium repens]|nr:hypothetical protein QL285_009295 [Trifolium repens]
MHRRRPIGHLRHEILICKDKTQALYSKHHEDENFSEDASFKELMPGRCIRMELETLQKQIIKESKNRLELTKEVISLKKEIIKIRQ